MISRRPTDRHNRGRVPVVAGSGGGGGGLPESAPAASAGPFSLANYLSSATLTNIAELSAGKTVVGLYQCDSITANGQTILSTANDAAGYYIAINTAGLRVQTNDGASAYTLTSTGGARTGVFAFAITRTAGGALRGSFCGAAAVLLNAAPVYNNSDAGAFFAIGRTHTNINADGRPASSSKVLAVGYINAESTDAELQAYTQQVNELDRYRFPDSVRNHASLVWEWDCYRDWNGIAGTTTCGLGSGPVTWTVNGTVTRNAIEAEYRVTDLASLFRDSKTSTLVTPQSSGAQYTMRDMFGDIEFTGNPSKLVIEAVADAGTLTGCIETTLLSDGTFQGSGLELDERSDLMPSGSNCIRARDWLGLSGSHTYRISNGIKLSTAGLVRQVAIQAIRYPKTATMSFAGSTAPSKRVVLDGDSITYNNAGLTGTNASPRAQCWNQLRRATLEGAGGSLLVIAWGGKQWFDICGDATKRTAYVSALATMLDGTVTNKLVVALGTNDYAIGLTPWSAASMQTGITALLASLVSAYPSIVIELYGPIARTTETANSFSNTCDDYRAAISAAAATQASNCTYTNGKSSGTNFITPANLTDGVHINVAGHAEFNTNAPAF